MLSSWQNGGLSRQLYSPALGTVNTSLQSLADSTQTVEQNWQSLIQNHGHPLMACIDSVERALSISTKANINHLQNTIENTKAALQDSESDVIRLGAETGLVVEDARARVAALRTEASNLQGTITSKEQEKRKIDGSIANTNALINQKEAEAHTLDDAAKTEGEAAEKLRIGGAFCVVLGVVAAPFTSGLSLGPALSVVTTGTGIAGIMVGEHAAGKASELRKSAESQRKVKCDLESQANNLGCGKLQVENELANTKQELGTVEGYQRIVESVLDKLHRYGPLLSVALKDIQDIGVALQKVSHSGDYVKVIQESFTQKSYACLPPTARRSCDDFLVQCRGIRGFLTQMGIPTSTSIQYINSNSNCFTPCVPPSYHTNGIPALSYPTQGSTPYPIPNTGLQIQPYPPPGLQTQTQFSHQSWNFYATLGSGWQPAPLPPPPATIPNQFPSHSPNYHPTPSSGWQPAPLPPPPAPAPNQFPSHSSNYYPTPNSGWQPAPLPPPPAPAPNQFPSHSSNYYPTPSSGWQPAPLPPPASTPNQLPSHSSNYHPTPNSGW